MKNSQQQPTHPQQLNFQKISQIQLLDLKQLDSITGGPIYMKVEGIKGNV